MSRITRVLIAAGLIILLLLPNAALAAQHAPGTSVAFSDVTPLHPAYAYIDFLARRGILSGYPDGRFGPADPLNRAAGTKLMTAIAGAAPLKAGALTFSDVPATHWAAPYVRAAIGSRLVNGFEDNTFRPDAPLTRAQLAALALRATRQSDQQLPSLKLNDVTPSDWYYRAALLAVASGMMEAPAGNFRPNDTATRAEAARAFAQALVYTPVAFDFPLAVTVSVERGRVEVAQPDSTQFTAITHPVQLPVGGRIRTQGASSASISFPDGSGLYLDNNSELKLIKSRGATVLSGPGLEDLEVELVRGRLFGAITPRLSPEELQAFQEQKSAVADEAARRDSFHAALVERIRWSQHEQEAQMPPGATRILLFTSPGSLEPGNPEGAELTVILANDDGEPVIASQPVQVRLLSDVGTFSNPAPVIPAGVHAVTVQLVPPSDEPPDAKTRVTAVVSDTTSSLVVPTAKISWWMIPFTKKARAKVRMPWSVATVRGSFISANVDASENSFSVLGGEGNLEAPTGDNTALGDNQSSRVTRPDQPPSQPAPLTTKDQQLWNAQQHWVQDQAEKIAQSAPPQVQREVQNENQRIANLVRNLPPDQTPPSIQISSPASGARFGSNTVTISGVATDNVKVSSVTVGGAPASVDAAGNWSASVTLQPGSNSVTASASDGAGNSATASVSLTFDPANPTISVSAPEQTREKTVTLTGQVSAPGGLRSVMVNGNPVSPGPDGSFSLQVTLEPGRNLITSEAVDQQGRTASHSIQLTSASLPPILSVSAPPEKVGKPQQVISGTAVAQYTRLASLTINGGGVLVGDDGSFTHLLTLKPGANAIEVVARDEAGNEARSSHAVTLDTEAPTVSLSAPRAGLITRQPQVEVSGRARFGAGLKSLTVGGQAVTPGSDGSFRTTISLKEGANSITAELVDQADRKASDSRTVHLVTNPPMLSLSQPEDGLRSARQEITVSGTAAAAFGPLSSVTVNGQTMLLGADGSFSATIQLASGENRVTASARDAAGNTSEVSRTVLFNPQAARLELNAPADKLITSNETVTVSGTVVNGPDVREVFVNGAPTGVGSGGSFSASVKLAGGRNLISVAVPASAGGARAERSVIYADRPPSLSVSPAEESITTAQPQIRFSGSALTSYGTPATVSVGGLVVPVDGGGGFSYALALKPGDTVVTISARDPAGNQSSVTRKVTYKPAAPLINVSEPTSGTVTKEPRITVRGVVTAPAGLRSVTVGGAAASVDVRGAFSATVELKPGENLLTITATDAAGGTASASVTVIRGGVPPVLTVSSPADGTVTGVPSVTATGTVSVTGGVVPAVTVSGVAAAVSATGSWTATVPLQEGANTLAITASDSLGGTASASRTVTYAPGAPSVEITAPAEGARLKEPSVTVTGRVKATALPVSVSVNGVSATPSADGYFSATVTLTAAGTQTITATATDALNRTGTAQRSVFLETAPPKLSLSSVNSTATRTVKVSGSVQVSSGLRLTALMVNGTPVSVDANGNLITEVTLSTVGTNTITVEATDSAGNTASSPLQVVWEPPPLAVTISSPSSGTTVTSNLLTVSGSVSGAVGATSVTVGGTTATVDSSGSFSATVTLLEGANTIAVEARDELGRTASGSVTVTYSPPPPPPAVPDAATSTISASSSATTAGGAGVTISVQLKDSSGNNITNTDTVVALTATGGTISTPVHQGSGLYTATFTPGTTATTANVTGTINGTAMAATASVSIRPGPASLSTSAVTANPTTVLPNTTTTTTPNTATITVQLKDQYGNLLDHEGFTPALTVSPLDLGTLSTPTYAGGGAWTAAFTPGANTGFATIQAWQGTSQFTSTATVSIGSTAAPDASKSTITIAPSLIPTGSNAAITVQLKDSAGIPLIVGGATVSLMADPSTAGQVSAVTDNQNGTYSATFTAFTQATDVSISGTVNNGWIPAATATIVSASKIWVGGDAADPTGWNVAANWSPAGVPTTSDTVLIKQASNYFPRLSASVTLAGLFFDGSGSLLDLAGHTLTVTGTADLRGGDMASNNLDGTLAAGGTLELTGTTSLNGYVPNLVVKGAVTVSRLSDYTGGDDVNIGGNLTVSGTAAILDLNGFSAWVDGSLRTESGGRLKMASANSFLGVGSNATFAGGSTDGLLTTGVLTVDGDFTQSTTTTAFAASGAHTVRFDGSGNQAVSLANAGSAGSRFANVQVNSGGTLEIATGTSLFVTGSLNANTAVTGSAATIGGNFSVPAGNAWQVTETTLTGTGTLVGEMATNLTINGARSLSGHVALTGNLTVSGTGADLNLNAYMMSVSGAFSTTNNGTLTSTASSGALTVTGTTSIGGGSTEGKLTAGVLTLKGNFTQPSSSSSAAAFAPSGTHTTHFAGIAEQTVSFNNPGSGSGSSRFHNVTFDNPASVTFNTTGHALGNVKVLQGSVAAPELTLYLYGNLEQTGGTWQPATTVIAGSPTLLPSTLASNLLVTGALTLPADLSTTGSVTVTGTGAGLNLNGKALTVGTNLTVSNGATLTMQNPLDKLVVQGNATFGGGSTAGLLTAGLAEVKGTFMQPSSSSSAAAFAPSGTHKVKLNGTQSQSVSFNNPDTGGSYFQEVEFANPAGAMLLSNMLVKGTATVSDGSVTTDSSNPKIATLAGSLIDTAGNRWAIETVFTGSPAALPPSISRNITFTGNAALPDNLSVTGTVKVSGSGASLTLNGKALSSSTFVVENNAVLKMTTAADALTTTGDLIIGGGSTSGLLTAGTITVGGNFSQPSSSSNAQAYAPSGTHKLTLSKAGAQSVSFNNPGLSGSYANHIEFAGGTQTTLNSNLHVAGDVTLTDGTVSGSTSSITATLNGNLTGPGSSGWQVSNTVLTAAAPSLPATMTTNLTFTSGTALQANLALTGALTVSGSAASLDLNGKTLSVTGNVAVDNNALLKMLNAADVLTVNGNVTVGGGSTAGLLTAGLLELTGNFTQPSSSSNGAAFAPSGTHKVKFVGANAQTASFNNPTTSFFNEVEFAGEISTTFASDAVIIGTATVTSGTVETSVTTGRITLYGALVDTTGDKWKAANTTLAANPGVLPSSVVTNLTVAAGVSVPSNLTVKGNLTITGTGASLNLNGKSVAVTGNFETANNGVLTMQNTADRLDVTGNASFGGGSTSNLLTAGNIYLQGNFTQPSSSSNGAAFAPSGTHKVLFVGGAGQTVSFNNPGSTQSAFQDAEFDNLGSGVSFTTSATIKGNAVVANGTVTGTSANVTLLGNLIDQVGGKWQVNTTSFYASALSLPASLTTNAFFFASTTLQNGFALTGNLTVTGSAANLNLNGKAVTVSGTLRVDNSAALTMTDSAGALTVSGNAVFAGGDSTGKLTAGTIQVGGNFEQPSSSSSALAFAPSGTLKVVLNGSGTQNITFSHPTSSYFLDLEVNKSSTTVGLNTDVLVKGQFRVVSASSTKPTVSGGGKTLTVHGVDVDHLTLNNARFKLVGEGTVTKFDNVTFTGYSTTVDQFVIERPLGLYTFNYLAFDVQPATGYYNVVAVDTDALLDQLSITLASPSSTFPLALSGPVTVLLL